MRFSMRISKCISAGGFIDPPGAASAGFIYTLSSAPYFYNGMMDLWRRCGGKYYTSLTAQSTGYNEVNSFV